MTAPYERMTLSPSAKQAEWKKELDCLAKYSFTVSWESLDPSNCFFSNEGRRGTLAALWKKGTGNFLAAEDDWPDRQRLQGSDIRVLIGAVSALSQMTDLLSRFKQIIASHAISPRHDTATFQQTHYRSPHGDKPNNSQNERLRVRLTEHDERILLLPHRPAATSTLLCAAAATTVSVHQERRQHHHHP